MYESARCPLSSPDNREAGQRTGLGVPHRGAEWGSRCCGLAVAASQGAMRAEMWPRCAVTHRAMHTAADCPAATHAHAEVSQATGEAGPLTGFREAGPGGTDQREAKTCAAPRGEAAVHCVDAPRDADASRFDVAPVSAAELDAERRWSGNGCPEATDEEFAAHQQLGGKTRGAWRRRRLRAGHYPVGFSPYLMSANKRGGITPLPRLVIKKDLKVCTCAHVWSVV